ncbi:VNG_1110C family protein [Haladaptatus sp. DFWS20]|uniref:VNG_1110C family protein n=1 Tax=Haladaptatus sp. DFWS20 TaxID=3403467 RepID=UPI003EB96F4A
MPNPARLRDSTQIVLPRDALNGIRAELERQFMISIVPLEKGYLRIVGSPVEIKQASKFLGRHGVSLP